MEYWNKTLLLCIIVIAVFSSCKKEIPEPVEVYKKQEGVFICNEGNFTFGNATLSFFDPNDKEISNQVFFNANSFPVGDVLQSMAIFEKKGFLLVNNSGKILVLDTDDFKHSGTITGLGSPRHIAFVNSWKAYVSDLYSKHITIINPDTYEISGSIFVGSSTEEMLIIDDFLYVTSWSYNNKLFKIDILANSVIDSVEIQIQPNSLVKDKNDKLWVLSDGGVDGQSGLTRLNPITLEIEKTFLFPGTNNSPTELEINGTGDTLFFINSSWSSGTGPGNGVCFMAFDDENLPEEPFIPEGNRLFYGLGIDPINSTVYVSNAIDFLQKGWVFRYRTSGEIIDSFKVDIVPGEFCFKTK